MQQGGQSKSIILPPNLIDALNGLVDRFNDSTSSLRVLLIGTNEGVCLARCYGTTSIRDSTEQTLVSSSSSAPLYSMREDILTCIETAWATLPSGCPPQLLASHAATTVSVSSSSAAAVADNIIQQPSHPLLKPLGFGDTVKTVTAFYDNITMIHVHLPPLVITILATPHVNLNMIQSLVIPILKILLEPVAQAIVSLQNENDAAIYSNAQQQQQKMVQSIVHR